jgi:hypothetical protein
VVRGGPDAAQTKLHRYQALDLGLLEIFVRLVQGEPDCLGVRDAADN